MTKPESWLKPLTELVVATAFWGFGFTATVWVLGSLDLSAIVFYRFMGAFLTGVLLIFLRERSLTRTWQHLRGEILFTLWPATWLFLTIALQAWGLYTTTATKSAFITVLYVIFVPIVSAMSGQDRPKLAHYACVVLALLGIAVFQQLRMEDWSFGDTLTLLCALAACFHILSLGKRAPKTKDPFVFNLWQSFWTGMMGLLLLPLGHRWDFVALNWKGWIGIISLALGSSLLAFYLQVRAQEKIPPVLASMLFLLESPFSAFFAFFLLGESIQIHHVLGAILILAACSWALRVDLPKQSQQGLTSA